MEASARGPQRIRWASWLLAIVPFLSFPAPARAVDTTPPTTPIVTGGGAYLASSLSRLTARWTSSDPESGIRQYQYHLRRDSTVGPMVVAWTTTRTSRSTSRYFRLTHGVTYYLGVRAQNGVGLWSEVGYAAGFTVDITPPGPVVVTDDGDVTASLTTLHATWTPAQDPESGIVAYYCVIRQDSSTGSPITTRNVGPITEMTFTGLRLVAGRRYYIGVAARNGAGRWSVVRYSDGILVTTDTTPPTGTLSIKGGEVSTNAPTVTLALSATDNRGTVSQMQFAENGGAYGPTEPYGTTKSWTLSGGDGAKTLSVRFSDPSGNWSTPASGTITLDMTPPGITITGPLDGAILGTP